jgi:hypothetical protein
MRRDAGSFWGRGMENVFSLEILMENVFSLEILVEYLDLS